MAIFKLIVKFFRAIFQATSSTGSDQETIPAIEENLGVIGPLTEFRKQSLANIFDALDAFAQENLAQTALKYDDESLIFELIPRFKDPDRAYSTLKTAAQIFIKQGKREALTNSIKLSYPLLSKLSSITTPPAGMRELSLLAIENLKPKVAWGLLAKAEKVIPSFKQLHQDVSREMLAEARLSVLRSIQDPQHGQKLLREIEKNIDEIDSANIKARAKVSLLEAQLAVYLQFDNQNAWQQAQNRALSLQQAHDPRPIAFLLQAVVQKGDQADAEKHYFKLLDQARLDLKQEPFLWFDQLKPVSKAYQAANKLDLFFEWIDRFPASFQLLEERGESNYADNPFQKVYPLLQLGELCLLHQRGQSARIFLSEIAGLIPEMNEKHLNRNETIDTYLEQLARLYEIDKQTDLFTATEQALKAYQDPIQIQLLISLAKTYYQIELAEKGDSLIKNFPLVLTLTPESKSVLWGRVYKPLFTHLTDDQSIQVLIHSVAESLVLEDNPLKQAMFILEFLRGAEEEIYSFSAASAERLIEGIDKYGDVIAKSIGRAAVVEHIELSSERSSQILRTAWDLIKKQEFKADFREQIFWVLPVVAKYEPNLAEQIFDYCQLNLKQMPASSEKDDWRDSLFWGLSNGPVANYSYEFVKSFGEAADEKVQSQIAATIERWCQQKQNINDLVSLLEIAATIEEPVHRAIAISSVATATADIGGWEYAFAWVKHIKLYYYTALAYIEMMIAYNKQSRAK